MHPDLNDVVVSRVAIGNWASLVVVGSQNILCGSLEKWETFEGH